MKEKNDFYNAINLIKDFLVHKKTGKIQINCFRGGVSTAKVKTLLNAPEELAPTVSDYAITLEDAMRYIKRFLVDKKVGNIEINCYRGKLYDPEINETVNCNYAYLSH